MTDQSSDYLRIAIIHGVHAFDGRLKIYLVTDFPERLKPGSSVLLKLKGGYVSNTIRECEILKNRSARLLLEGINSREQAERLKGVEIFISKSNALAQHREMEEGSFYYFEIIGCSVYKENKLFGTVKDILEAGAGEVLVITDSEGNEYMIPFVGSMVETEGVSKGRIDINPLEGILDI